jgi:CRP/FNR family transcriptional regulator, cyclic AMP receptor protein
LVKRPSSGREGSSAIRESSTATPDVLRDVALFATLSEVTLERISAVVQVRDYAPNTHILWEGERAEAAYFVLRGQVRIYRVSREGREQVLVRLEPGQAFNTVPAFEDEGLNRASAVTLTGVTLAILPREDLQRLVLTHGDLAMALLRDFAGRLTHLTDLVEGLALHTVQERLARFLLNQAESEAPGSVQRWTQQEIATHLGTVRDVVGRELRALEDAGAIRIERGQIILLDREALTAIATQTP